MQYVRADSSVRRRGHRGRRTAHLILMEGQADQRTEQIACEAGLLGRVRCSPPTREGAVCTAAAPRRYRASFAIALSMAPKTDAALQSAFAVPADSCVDFLRS